MRIDYKVTGGVLKVTGLGIVAALAHLASAVEISQKDGYKGDASGSSSFVNGTGWADGMPPEPGKDYLWKQGGLRTPDNGKSAATDSTTYRFAGDKLTLASGNNAAITQKTCGENALTVVSNLVVQNNTSWTQSCAVDTLARIGGKITIDGSGTFCLKSSYTTSGCHYDMQVQSSLVGASGCSVSISQLSYVKAASVTDPVCPARSYIRIAGDNQGFYGKWKVANIKPSSGYPYIDEEGIVLVLESANALGGDTGTMVADAVQLSNHGGLAIAPELCAEGPFAPVNKGLTIGARGGRLTTVGDETWELGMPIAGGEDKNLFKSGRGTIRLCGAYAAGPITVEEGVLVWASDSAVPSAVTVSPGAAFCMRVDETTTLSGVLVPGVELAFDAANKTCARLDLDATCTLPSGPIPVRFDSALPADDTTRYEVLTIPISVRKVVAADFVDITEKLAGSPMRWFAVMTENGIQHVILYQNPPMIVMSDATAGKNPDRTNGQWFITDATAWSDGKELSPSKDYCADKAASGSFRTSGGSTGTVVFRGNSLTLEKTIAHKNAELVVTNFILKSDSLINASGNAGRVSQIVSGTLIVDDGCTDSHPAKIEGTLTQNIDIASDISGTGVISFQPYDSSKTTVNIATSHLSGDNSRFGGRILATSWYVNNNQTNVGQTLSFAAPQCLGGPLSVFDYRAVHIGRCCTLRATDTMTLETANRGLYFEPGAAIDVAVGTLTIAQPLRKVGVLHKVGVGTLALGGDISFGSTGLATATAEDDRVVQVDEGGLAVASQRAVRELSIKIAAAGSLVVCPEASDESVRTNGLYSEKVDAIVLMGTALAVDVAASAAFWEKHTSFTVPVCTVPKVLGDQLRGKIKMIHHKGYKGVVVPQDLVGDMTRFILNVEKKGFVLVFR